MTTTDFRMCLFNGLMVLVLVSWCSTLLADVPTELGVVNWQRDLGGAAAQAAQSGKPLFVQFQEVPGCATCQNYGRDVLSHLLLVEAIEDNFTPVLVYNNRPGEDKQLLGRFNEPAWNNPVVRFLKSDLTDLIPRRDQVWNASDMAQRMVAALKAAGLESPRYLQLVIAEKKAVEQATMAMHCFWEGEARLGRLPGVLRTRAAWLDGKEVVDVEFDPDTISYRDLVTQAHRSSCASVVFAKSGTQEEIAAEIVGPDSVVLTDELGKAAKASDQKYYLKQSPVRFLPITPIQTTRVNSALVSGKKFAHWLSPRQRRQLAEIRQVIAKSPESLDIVNPSAQGGDLMRYQAKLDSRLKQLLKRQP